MNTLSGMVRCHAGYGAKSVSDAASFFPRAVIFDYFGTLTSAVRQGPTHRWMARSLGCDPDAWLKLMAETFYKAITQGTITATSYRPPVLIPLASDQAAASLGRRRR